MPAGHGKGQVDWTCSVQSTAYASTWPTGPKDPSSSPALCMKRGPRQQQQATSESSARKDVFGETPVTEKHGRMQADGM